MASKVDICNRALVILGADTIMELGEDSEEARKCNVLYDEARQTVIRDYPWNACTKQATLALLVDEPVFNWQYAYQLPTDCLRVITTEGEKDHAIQGRRLLSNESDVAIQYIADIEDPQQYDGMLREALSSYLAYSLAYAVTESSSRAEALYQKYLNTLSRARGVDSQEGTPPLQRPTRWVRAHSRGFSTIDSRGFVVPE